MTTHDTGFLRPAPASPAADRLFADDREKFGYVMNLSRAWAHVPAAHHDLFDLLAGEAGADVAAGVLRGDAAWSPPNGHSRRGSGSSRPAPEPDGRRRRRGAAEGGLRRHADRDDHGLRGPCRSPSRRSTTPWAHGPTRSWPRPPQTPCGCREFRGAGRRVGDAVARPAGRRRVSRFAMIGSVETRGIQPLTPPCKIDQGLVWRSGL
jgi:hypothetical protein